MRITKKRVKEFLDNNFYIGKSRIPNSEENEVYYSKYDNGYLTHVGMEESIKYLIKLGISEKLQKSYKDGNTVSIGFNPILKKWYGWSHRAIFGFTIGSTCKKGNCHYQPKNKKDYIEDYRRFWDDPHHKKTYVGAISKKGFNIEWEYGNTVPNKKLRGQINSTYQEFPKKYGKGEWTAKTMKEAKQMAIDFARGVS